MFQGPNIHPSDIVLVQRVIQSDAAVGRVAKLAFKATVHYIVLWESNPGTYYVRKMYPLSRILEVQENPEKYTLQKWR